MRQSRWAAAELDCRRCCLQLWIFGVLIALQLSWDGRYTCAADQLRLAPADAAEVLGAWAGLCRARQVRGARPGHSPLPTCLAMRCSGWQHPPVPQPCRLAASARARQLDASWPAGPPPCRPPPAAGSSGAARCRWKPWPACTCAWHGWGACRRWASRWTRRYTPRCGRAARQRSCCRGPPGLARAAAAGAGVGAIDAIPGFGCRRGLPSPVVCLSGTAPAPPVPSLSSPTGR